MNCFPGRLMLSAIAVSLTACAAQPSVTYTPAKSSDETGHVKFVLPHSLIILSRKDPKDQPTQLNATSVPTDAGETWGT